jgi:hypothetical protein
MNKGGFGLPFGQILKEQESAVVDVNTTVVETILRSFPVPARVGELGAETRLLLWGDVLHNNVAGDSLTLQMRLGKGVDITGTVLGKVAFNFQNQVGATRYNWIVQATLTGLGEGRYVLDGVLTCPRTDSGLQTAQTWTSMTDTVSTGTPVAAVGGLQQVVVTATWGASSANNAVRKFGSLMIFDPKSSGML